MGANQSGLGGPGGPGGGPGEEKKKEKKKWQPPPPPQRVGKKLKKKGIDGATRLPDVAPASKFLLRKLKLERVKDWLLMEEEFVTNQERIKPHTERAADDQSKVDELRGSPMSVGNLEEIIDDKYAPARVRPRPRLEPRTDPDLGPRSLSRSHRWRDFFMFSFLDQREC